MQVAAVVGGTVDATLSLEPVGSIAVASGKAVRAMTNPVARVIADPFYSGASIMTTKFLKERPEVASKVIAVIDEATDLVNANFAKYKRRFRNTRRSRRISSNSSRNLICVDSRISTRPI